MSLRRGGETNQVDYASFKWNLGADEVNLMHNCHLSCGLFPLKSWTSGSDFFLQRHACTIAHSPPPPPQQLPPLVRGSHSSSPLTHELDPKETFFCTQPSRILWKSDFFFLLLHGPLLFKYNTTLKRWPDHVLTNSVCKYSLNLIILFLALA